AGSIDQDRGVEAPLAVAAFDQLAIAEIEADAAPGRGLEQRRRRGVRHLALEEALELVLLGDVPAREEGRVRHLRKDDHRRPAIRGAAEQGEEGLDHAFPRLASGNGSELADGQRQAAIHVVSLRQIAAVTMISTRYWGPARRDSTVARAGGFFGSIHASQAA